MTQLINFNIFNVLVPCKQPYNTTVNIYEEYFNVAEFPEEAGEIINRLGAYYFEDKYDKNTIAKDLKILDEKYGNIKAKYTGLVTKAADKAEKQE